VLNRSRVKFGNWRSKTDAIASAAQTGQKDCNNEPRRSGALYDYQSLEPEPDEEFGDVLWFAPG
jgi:hypothetical protein